MASLWTPREAIARAGVQTLFDRDERSQAQGIVVWAAISTPREAVARAGVKTGIHFWAPREAVARAGVQMAKASATRLHTLF